MFSRSARSLVTKMSMQLRQCPVSLKPMHLGHLPAVLEIEREAFALPWPEHAYRYELTENRLAHYYVLSPRLSPDTSDSAWRRLFGRVRREAHPEPDIVWGYAGFWMMVDEAHISTLAIRHDMRRRGLGEFLLAGVIDEARRLRASVVTLEVRVSNLAAQALYTKYGFEPQGRRKRYYPDNNEDALIMTTPPLTSPGYSRLLVQRWEHLMARLALQALDKPGQLD